MVDHKNDNLESILRKRVSQFLRFSTAHRAPLKPFLREVNKLGESAFLFGGTLRDLMSFGLQKEPRDIDIVVLKLSDKLRSFLKPHIRKNTRLGGIEVNLGHWAVDLWELSSTWAFRSGLIKTGTFETLPKTTFLDVQAIIAKISTKPGHERKIFEHGFFKAIRQKTIGINFEENPYPARCVLSALMTAHKLDFSLSPTLIRYILHHAANIDLQELCDDQKQHSGYISFTADTIHGWIGHLDSCYRHCHSSYAKLPAIPLY